jgi:hypothetical protein
MEGKDWPGDNALYEKHEPAGQTDHDSAAATHIRLQKHSQ